ncbi:MAG TPA: DEAD/DEAH box helicase, partial [Mycobacteriales bacterium]|nr:DEAD/DEAH box helicase [Mycobacteriales bacterium]
DRRPAGRGPRRPAKRTGASRPAPRPSALDQALTAAQSAPEPTARTFAALGLPEALVRALSWREIHEPFAIQRRALPDALAGRDVLGRAQTGSGKTLAFGLPMLTRLHSPSHPAGSQGGAARAPKGPRRPRGLVLVPTRELARQVADAITPLARALQLHVTTVFGGVSYGQQMGHLERGTDIIVATPGRLIDLMDRDAVRLDAIEVAVLDEADHMADLGFLPAVKTILDATPPERQCLLFSATLDRGVDKLVTSYLNDPAFHAVAAASSPVESMEHLVFVVKGDDKVAVAGEIAQRPARTLFFVRTKHGADRLARQLEKQHEVRAAAIHGNLNQNQRLRALDGFSSGRVRVLVATDVAARGLHIDDVDLVVHYDPPNDHKDYLHRSGRTARAGASGTVVTLAYREQLREVGDIHRDAAVTATTTDVTPTHPSVVALAESGAAVEVTEQVTERRTERPRTARPRSERPWTDRPSGDGRRTDRPRSDRPRTDRPRSDRPRADRPQTDGPGTERTDSAQAPAARTERPRTARADRGRPAPARAERTRTDRPWGDQPRTGDRPA